MSTRRVVATWVAIVLLASIFVLVGLSKLAGPSAIRWADRFVRWGYPANATRAVGILEVVAGIAVLLPRARRAAAFALLATMVGAVATHVLHGELPRIVAPMVLGALALFLWRQDPAATSRKVASAP